MGLERYFILQGLTKSACELNTRVSCTRKPNSQPGSGRAGLESLPFECLKSIVSNVNSPEDLESASLASPTLALVINDEVLWRRLVTRSFTPSQIMSVQFGRASWRSVPPPAGTTASLMPGEIRDCNWRRAYIRLLRRFGEQQVYSACLGICENCSCLYWVVRFCCFFYQSFFLQKI